MLVGLELFRRDFLKFRKKGAHFALGGSIVQAFEEVLNLLGARPLREAYSLLFPHDAHYSTLPLVGEEKVQPYTKHQGDAQERGKRGKQFPPLKFGKERSGESGVLAEFYQPHALAEAQGTQFFPDGITP